MTIKYNYKEGYEYVPAPLDEKNLTTDWLEDFFFDSNCATRADWNEIAGYGYIEGKQCLCEVKYSNNIVTWKFLHMDYLEEQEVLDFAKNLQEYLKDSESIAFTVRLAHHKSRKNDFENKITVIFKSKIE